MKKIRDRTDAGRQLAVQLCAYAGRTDTAVLGLPRGGVPVAYEIARTLDLPLDICLVRKLSVPRCREMAIGAIAANRVRVLNNEVMRWLEVSDREVEQAIAKEQTELQRRAQAYRGDWPPLDIRDRIVILVDDGIATGATVKAALTVLRSQQPQKIVLAVPVAPPSEYRSLEAVVDQIVCLMTPHPFHAISMWYEDFSQTTDDQVRRLLGEYLAPLPSRKGSPE